MSEPPDRIWVTHDEAYWVKTDRNRNPACLEYLRATPERLAAPDLLEACEALLDAFEGYEMMAALDYKVQDLARAAITKATSPAP